MSVQADEENKERRLEDMNIRLSPNEQQNADGRSSTPAQAQDGLHNSQYIIEQCLLHCYRDTDAKLILGSIDRQFSTSLSDTTF